MAVKQGRPPVTGWLGAQVARHFDNWHSRPVYDASMCEVAHSVCDVQHSDRHVHRAMFQFPRNAHPGIPGSIYVNPGSKECTQGPNCVIITTADIDHDPSCTYSHPWRGRTGHHSA